MGSSTAAGSTIAFSAAAPATFDAAGYGALTFTEVGGVESIGTLGASTGKVDFQPLKGPREKHKGSTDYGSLQPSIALDDADAGQTLMKTAAEPDNNALYSTRVIYPSGAKRFFQSRVFGWPEDVGGADSILMAKPTVEINTKIVKVAAT
ncbi:hypothetical protein [Sphingobium sp. YR768]|uniref:hypothetical protein n=1 Tax=Sphingobium sp. YR768 TaxID=1884365 RepID=UPI0008B4B1AD|nr:hypothetical protein [Sphingobium sp. YR768]SEQ60524.1 hypothetical protein SAMN05518866_101494 [Sphingobium sp. YR768]